MKKYIKPKMTFDKIEMNQAIARCSKGSQGFVAQYLGWCNLRAGGAPASVYETKEEALAVSAGWGGENSYAACMCWEILGTRQDGSYGHVAFYEDTDHDETLSGGTISWLDPTISQGTDHWQSVLSTGTDIETVFIS